MERKMMLTITSIRYKVWISKIGQAKRKVLVENLILRNPLIKSIHILSLKMIHTTNLIQNR